MKLTILQESLKEGLAIVERMVSKSLTLPILNNVLLRAKKPFLDLSATDLELGVNWQALAKIEEEGAAVIPSQVVSSLIGFFPNKPINIFSDNSVVNIECGNHRSSIRVLAGGADDFPPIPLIAEGESLSVPAEVFCRGLSQVVSIPAQSTAKPEISGVYFSFRGDAVKMAATDSFRLGEKTLPVKGGGVTASFILPQRAAKEIVSIFSQNKEIKIFFSPNQISFKSWMEETGAPKIQFVSRLIEGEFPNYEAIIPQKEEASAAFNRKEFLNQIRSAGIFSGKTNEVKLAVDPVKKQIEICGQSQDLGEYRSEVAARIKGKKLDVSFNYKFLTEGILMGQEGEEMIFSLAGEEGPAVLKQASDPSYIYILMPIKKS